MTFAKAPQRRSVGGIKVKHLPYSLVAVCLLFLLVAAGPLNQPIFGDEIPIIENLVHFVRNKTIIPVMYNYPTFYSYFLTLILTPLALVLHIVAGLSPAEIELRLIWPIYGMAAATSELILLRLPSVLMGLGVILTTYSLGRAYCEHRVGLIAAGLIASTHTFVFRATLILPDILVVLLTTLTLRLCFDVLNRPSRQTATGPIPPLPLIGAAALSRIAVATKYNAALIVLPVYLVSVTQWINRPDGLVRLGKLLRDWPLLGRVFRDLLLLTAICLLAFILTCPGWLLVPHEYKEGLLYESRHMMEGQLYIEHDHAH